MLSNSQTFVAFLLSLLFLSAAGSASVDSPVYKVLQSNDFPVGILSKGVTHHDLDASFGKFNADLNSSYSFSLEGTYQLRYKSKISEYIHKDKLSDLSGVSVKVLFLGLNIVEVRRNGEKLEFSVEIASTEFGIKNFYVCPQCGCGLNCKTSDDHQEMGKLRTNPLVSSS
ncbi:hypothetical protein Salat_1693300 [Sesamum alatum]|uniref:Uncharacterized protein n=1 Tax=Sesamum alatum TaxID=300844 RepID=A0AAE2CK10_9LAMI|nr:hypothetical protein Salat_1693300 [Sesamum alatum]